MVHRPRVSRLRRTSVRFTTGQLLGVGDWSTAGRGAVFDVAVDIRVGSPTFGQWDSVLLDDQDRRSIYVSEGLGHAFLALQDDSTVMYLCSAGYDPACEHTINVMDPAFDIVWPDLGGKPIMSDRDREAPTLDEVKAAGQLPTWDEAKAFVEELRRRSS